MFNNKLNLFLFWCITGMCMSCVGTKKVTYLQNLSSAERSVIDSVAAFTEPVIQTDDILAISINTNDPQSSAVVNQASSLQSVGASSNISRQEISGFLVDKNGEVELTRLGKIKVRGLTTYQAKELVRSIAAKDFKNPAVSVRFANFKVSVLGEVNRPAAYNLPNEKVSILDVLTLAGDLTLYGKRENIAVIREMNGRKEVGRLNLNSVDIFQSPFYYMKQNDVVYVEPNKAKVISLNSAARTTFAVAISALSTLVLIFTRLN